jgi:hypothetical protein
MGHEVNHFYESKGVDLRVHITYVYGIRNLVKVRSGKLILGQLGHLEREFVCGKVDIRDEY